MRKEEALRKFLEEAECRVSWVRKKEMLNRISNGEDPVPPGIPYTEDEWKKRRLEALGRGFKSILSKGYVNPENPLDGMEYDYWVGIMSALRWVLGDDKHFLDT